MLIFTVLFQGRRGRNSIANEAWSADWKEKERGPAKPLVAPFLLFFSRMAGRGFPPEPLP